MGRRVLVRWDLKHSPDNLDLVVQLPEEFARGGRYPTLSRVHSRTIEDLQKVMADPENWVGLVGRFGYERALSDYIALYPHRLEDGLVPHPDTKIRERVFTDRSRLDVLLLDRREVPVIVECKQESPTVGSIHQLRGYIRRLRQEIGVRAQGILVHGGARKLDADVQREALKSPRVEIIQYRLDVDFSPSY
jgi:RecB family endonuclease NucS